LCVQEDGDSVMIGSDHREPRERERVEHVGGECSEKRHQEEEPSISV
jgi:hypothetical protein